MPILEELQAVAAKRGTKPTPDRRAPDPWRDDVDSHLQFLRTEAATSSRNQAEFRIELDNHTQMLGHVAELAGQIKETLDHKVTPTLLELAPVVTSVKVAKKTSMVAGVAADIGSRLVRAAAYAAAVLAFILAITHGETWTQALKAFWHVVTGADVGQ